MIPKKQVTGQHQMMGIKFSALSGDLSVPQALPCTEEKQEKHAGAPGPLPSNQLALESPMPNLAPNGFPVWSQGQPLG